MPTKKQSPINESEVIDLTDKKVNKLEQELSIAEVIADESSTKLAKINALIAETERVVASSPYSVEPMIQTSTLKAIING